MDHLYAPWRAEYIKRARDEDQRCVFCTAAAAPEKDAEQQVLLRSKSCYVMMNRYPYTPGHFMIIPYVHTGDPAELDSLVWAEMCELTQKGSVLLQEGYGAQGVNIGMNIGVVGGAGLADHLHMHLVPRWSADTNFISVIGDVRVYSMDFQKVYETLKALCGTFF